MYESPIQVNYRDVIGQQEENIVRVVLSYDINVDKEELLKALNYDRQQYCKGYDEGYNAGYSERGKMIVRCKECQHWVEYKGRKDNVGECMVMNRIENGLFFCSRGERKEEQ